MREAPPLAEPPAVSVIVVAYNEEARVRRCLESLRAQSWTDFEVIVVDNASTDRTGEIVRTEFPEFTHALQASNLGFSEGTNAGYRLAHAAIIAFLNADAWVPPNWLEDLVRPLRAEGSGGVGCTHSPVLNEGAAYRESTATFDPSAARLSTLSVAGRNCTTRLPWNADDPFFGSGVALAVRREAAGDALFDPDYFLWSDDTSLGWRLRLEGWQLRMVATAPAHHALPFEGKPLSAMALRLAERNRLFNIYIFYTPRVRWLLKPLLALDLIGLALPKPGRVSPEGDLVPATAAPASPEERRAQRHAVIQGVIEALASYRALRRKHARAQARRRVGDEAVTRSMTARLFPYDEGWVGWINRASLAWCKAFGIPTVESAGRGTAGGEP
ncbi:MAG TPA: glycosyltransferase family 2 protein [Candidatus Thermoplasmatota archaeon]